MNWWTRPFGTTERMLAFSAHPSATVLSTAFSLDMPLREARERFERLYFLHHIRREEGNMSRVAERVGLERTHLYRKLKQLGIRPSSRGEDPPAD